MPDEANRLEFEAVAPAEAPRAAPVSQRDAEMAALGYQPAEIRDEEGAVVLAYFTKSWSREIGRNEI